MPKAATTNTSSKPASGKATPDDDSTKSEPRAKSSKATAAKNSPAKKTPASTRTSKNAGRNTGKTATKASTRADAEWDAAKDILTAHRTLARAEKRESDLAAGLTTHKKTLQALDKQSAALHKTLSRASDELATAISARRKVAKKLHKLESRA